MKTLVIMLLDNYFAKKDLSFTDLMNLISSLKVSDNQKKVMTGLLEIGHGKTVSYSEFAEKIAKKSQVRSIATLIGKNPLPVIVPCHRIIRKSGEIGNYILGSEIKQELIDFERGILKVVKPATIEVVKDFYSDFK